MILYLAGIGLRKLHLFELHVHPAAVVERLDEVRGRQAAGNLQKHEKKHHVGKTEDAKITLEYIPRREGLYRDETSQIRNCIGVQVYMYRQQYVYIQNTRGKTRALLLLLKGQGESHYTTWQTQHPSAGCNYFTHYQVQIRSSLRKVYTNIICIHILYVQCIPGI